MPVEPQSFKDALRRFAAGVTVVTARTAAGLPVGLTVTAFSSVSLSPPLIQICLGRHTADLAAYSEGGGFVVNILSEDQKDLSNLFAGHAPDRFERTPHETWDSTVPVLTGCLANLECRPWRVVEAGDHLLIVGQVERARCAAGDLRPLLHVQGGYARRGDFL